MNVTSHLRPERRLRMGGVIPHLTVYALTSWTRVVLHLPFFSVEPVPSMFRVEEIGAGWREDGYRVWYLVAVSRAVEPVRKTGFHKPQSHSQKSHKNDEISTSPRGLGILYKTLLARKLPKPEDGRYRPKRVVFCYC